MKKKYILKILIISTIILTIVLGLLIYLQSDLKIYIQRFTKEPKFFEIKDECSILAGNL